MSVKDTIMLTITWVVSWTALIGVIVANFKLADIEKAIKDLKSHGTEKSE